MRSFNFALLAISLISSLGVSPFAQAQVGQPHVADQAKSSPEITLNCTVTGVSRELGAREILDSVKKGLKGGETFTYATRQGGSTGNPGSYEMFTTITWADGDTNNVSKSGCGASIGHGFKVVTIDLDEKTLNGQIAYDPNTTGAFPWCQMKPVAQIACSVAQ